MYQGLRINLLDPRLSPAYDIGYRQNAKHKADTREHHTVEISELRA